MTDRECIEFLQWALPRLRMRWGGFRKVRKQVCKRVQRRSRALNLRDVAEYRGYLEAHAREWTVLCTLCRITISRFYRNRGVFEVLEGEALPLLLRQARARGDRVLHVWSAGCGSGEEPYSLSLLWHECLAARFPELELRIFGTDADAALLQRAGNACYPGGCLKELPDRMREAGFTESDGLYRLDAQYERAVEFSCQDIREQLPEASFDLILCRNLVFTYFDTGLQRDLGERITEHLRDGGILVVGSHERLPAGIAGMAPWRESHGIYRKCNPST